MTKSIRIENADTSNYKVVVEVWQVGTPDTLVRTIELNYPTAMVEDVIHDGQYLIVRENGENDNE